MVEPAAQRSPEERSRSGDTLFDEQQFARMLVERRFVSPAEFELARARQREYEAQGRRVPIVQVLLEMNYVTKSQVRRLALDMEDSLSKPAERIPGYEILGKIGSGAMATVFKARQLSLDRIVAIKVLPKRLSENPEFVERFYKEGRAAAQLNHNNIVQAIDVGEAAGYHYFVMEYVDGKTVYDDLQQGKAYTEERALDIVIQIAQALAHAHDRGFIHRDVKPKNIMITRDGVAKLADMGLARATSDKEAAEQEAGRAYGTPYYISPEQIRGEVNIDHRADIYSLGATFYHMVTGRVPFDGPTPTAVMHKHLREPLVPPDHINPKLSSGVAEIIEVMMAKDRNDRYANCRDLLEDLKAVREGRPPLLARQRYDHAMLKRLGDSGETVELPAETPAKPSPQETGITTWLILLGIVNAVLIIIVIVLAVFMLSR